MASYKVRRGRRSVEQLIDPNKGANLAVDRLTYPKGLDHELAAEFEKLIRNLRSSSIGKPADGKLVRFNSYDRTLLELAVSISNTDSCHSFMYETIMDRVEELLNHHFKKPNLKRSPDFLDIAKSLNIEINDSKENLTPNAANA